MPQRWNRPSATPRATSRTRRGLSVRSRCRSETMRPRLVRFWCVKRRARSPPCSAGADCGDSFPGQELMRSPLSAEGICQCAKPIFTAAGHRPVSPARSLEPLSEVDVAVPPKCDKSPSPCPLRLCRPAHPPSRPRSNDVRFEATGSLRAGCQNDRAARLDRITAASTTLWAHAPAGRRTSTQNRPGHGIAASASQ